MKPQIHPSAVVDQGAVIGDGTKVWHFCHIMSRARIGENCVLGQNVFVANGAILGNHVKVQNNVSIYDGVICEDGVFIGPSAVFTNVINPRSTVERKNEFQQTYIRRGATIGANATILCGIEIGAYAFIGAGSVITKDVAPYAIMVGNPGDRMGWMSRHGSKLDFDRKGVARCSVSGLNYILDNGKVRLMTEEEE